MKASTFAIVVGATVSAIAPIGVVNPSGYVTALADLLGQSSLVHTIAVALLAMGTLVLLQPVAGRSLKLRLVRAVAWLTVVKSLLMLWAPALVESVTAWMTTLPAVFLLDALKTMSAWMTGKIKAGELIVKW